MGKNYSRAATWCFSNCLLTLPLLGVLGFLAHLALSSAAKCVSNEDVGQKRCAKNAKVPRSPRRKLKVSRSDNSLYDM
ncbi:MAG TPA: hypothetical protein VFC78_02070 [Tepidisphaeraceae bacterium]|nr:hypothetical protein [Tepidisphaeraceae bacterium]